jgi:hypothetical protein
MMTAVTQDAHGGTWAMPGSAAEPAPEPQAPAMPSGPASPGASGTPAASGAPAEGAVPHVALRPMTVADVLDGAFAIIKARPRKIIGFTAAFVVPVQLAVAFLQRNSTEAGFEIWFSEDPTIAAESSSDGGDLLTMILLLIVPSIALVCVAAGLAHLVSAWSVGRDATGREMFGVVGRRSWALLATFVVVHLAEIVGGLGCYVGAFFVMALFVPVAPIIGAEKAGAGAALGRSFRLVKARYWPVLGTALLMGIVATLLGYALSSLPQGLAGAIGMEDGWPLFALGGIVSQVVTTPFVAAATVLLYLDLRVRTEGLDIELDARRAFDRAG